MLQGNQREASGWAVTGLFWLGGGGGGGNALPRAAGLLYLAAVGIGT